MLKFWTKKVWFFVLSRFFEGFESFVLFHCGWSLNRKGDEKEPGNLI